MESRNMRKMENTLEKRGKEKHVGKGKKMQKLK